MIFFFFFTDLLYTFIQDGYALVSVKQNESPDMGGPLGIHPISLKSLEIVVAQTLFFDKGSLGDINRTMMPYQGNELSVQEGRKGHIPNI